MGLCSIGVFTEVQGGRLETVGAMHEQTSRRLWGRVLELALGNTVHRKKRKNRSGNLQ